MQNDDWARYQRERGLLLAGLLGLALSVYGVHHPVWPELQFGHVVGDALVKGVVKLSEAEARS